MSAANPYLEGICVVELDCVRPNEGGSAPAVSFEFGFPGEPILSLVG